MAIGKRTTRRRPYRRSRKSIRRRRYNRRYRKTAKSGLLMKMPSTMVPPRMLTKVKYTNTIIMTDFTTPISDNDLTAFSYKDLPIFAAFPYAPYGINVADLPAGLNLWSQFYGEVAVTKCKVRVTPISFIGTSGNTSVLPYVISITPIPQYYQSGQPLPYTSGTVDFIEQPMTRRKYFNIVANNTVATGDNNAVYVSAQNGYQISQSVSHSMTSKKMLGYSKLYDCDQPSVWYATSLSTETGSGVPNSSWYFNISVKSTLPWDGASPTAQFIVDDLVAKIEIEYSLAFRDRKLQLEEVPSS